MDEFPFHPDLAIIIGRNSDVFARCKLLRFVARGGRHETRRRIQADLEGFR